MRAVDPSRQWFEAQLCSYDANVIMPQSMHMVHASFCILGANLDSCFRFVMPPHLSTGDNMFGDVRPSLLPSIFPKPEIPSFHPYMGPLFHPTTMTVLRPIHPSVRQEMFPGISRKTHGENGLKFCMLIYPDYPQNWLDLGRALLILLIFVPLWLSETGHIWGLRALHGEHLGVNVTGARRHISDAMRRVLSIFSRSGAIMRLSQCIWGGNL